MGYLGTPLGGTGTLSVNEGLLPGDDEYFAPATATVPLPTKLPDGGTGVKPTGTVPSPFTPEAYAAYQQAQAQPAMPQVVVPPKPPKPPGTPAPVGTTPVVSTDMSPAGKVVLSVVAVIGVGCILWRLFRSRRTLAGSGLSSECDCES